MVARQTLTLFVWVRALVPQPEAVQNVRLFSFCFLKTSQQISTNIPKIIDKPRKQRYNNSNTYFGGRYEFSRRKNIKGRNRKRRQRA